MAKLNQIIAIEKGIKAQSYGKITELDKESQKPALFNGIAKDYHKQNTESEDLPPEHVRVQRTVPALLREVSKVSTEWYNLAARKDWTNRQARADVTVGGVVLVRDVPIGYLLFLEKQITDLRTLVKRVPELDEAENWSHDEQSGLWKTPVIKTHRTKKEQVPITLLQPTTEHPGQAQLITKDVLAGHWHLVKTSGAMAKPEKETLLEKIEKLLQAVIQAREEANGIDEVTAPKVGEDIFHYLLGV